MDGSLSANIVFPKNVHIGHKVSITDTIEIAADTETRKDWARRINSPNNLNPPKCQCGCGQRVYVNPRHHSPSKGAPKFIPAHRSFVALQSRNLDFLTKGSNPGSLPVRWAKEQNKKPPICKCGCEKPIFVRPKHRYRGIPDYLPYHMPHCNKKKEGGGKS